MIPDDAIWQYLPLIANAFLIGGAALAVLRVQRELQRCRELRESPAATALAGDAYDDRGLRRMIDQRFLTLAARLDGLQAPLPKAAGDAAAAVPPPAGGMSFDYAARMARAGASVDELVRGCGLNRGEAQLLVRLHAGSGPSAARH